MTRPGDVDGERYCHPVTTTTDAYTARAREYADVLGSMSAVHPSDRRLVDSWACTVSGPVVDAGCGPGHWTDHLQRLGLEVRGIDPVPAFVAHARSTYPAARFDVADMEDLPPDENLGGIFSWFSTIHHAPGDIPRPLAAFARALRPGGTLVLGFFSGTVVEPFDHAVVRAHRWAPQDLRARVQETGFRVTQTTLRHAPGERPVGALVCERLLV